VVKIEINVGYRALAAQKIMNLTCLGRSFPGNVDYTCIVGIDLKGGVWKRRFQVGFHQRNHCCRPLWGPAFPWDIA
jgi:hypothetical protein